MEKEMKEKATEIEEWRDVPNYEGYYQVSDFGRVRSLDRTLTDRIGRVKFHEGKVIKGSISNGYKQTTLWGDNTSRGFTFSQLVAMAFLGHKPSGHDLVIDHINGDRLDDRVGNLQIVTHRANLTTCFRSNEDSFSSKYTGVCWSISESKWKVSIRFKEASFYLGSFDDELEASDSYQLALSKIKDGSFNPVDYKPKWTSKYKGVYFSKERSTWVARVTVEGRIFHIGSYTSEIEASNAYQRTISEIKDGSFNPDDYKPKWTSQYKGVGFHRASGKWQGRVTVAGRREHLGLFPTEIEARDACEAKIVELNICK